MAHHLPLADIKFIADFAAYARTREPSERYLYESNSNCACAQFLRDTGRAVDPSVGGWSWSDEGGEEISFSEGLTEAIQETGSWRPDAVRHTWGELADRLEALIAASPEVR